MEIGMVVPFAGATPPSGYLLCDGASYLRSSYSALFGVIGTAFGSADSTHFNVPDLRGRAVYGVGSGVGGGIRGSGKPVGSEALNTGESVPFVGKVIPTVALGDYFGKTEMYQHADQVFEHQHTVNQVAHSHGMSIAPHTHTVTNPPHNHTQYAHNHTQDAHRHVVFGNMLTDGGTSRRQPAAASSDDVQSAYATATNQAATATNQAATQETAIASASLDYLSGSTTPEAVSTGWFGDNVPFDVLSPGVALNYIIQS